MRYIEFDIPIYDWSLCVVTLYDETDRDEYVRLCERYNIDSEQSNEDIDKIVKGVKDFACCYTAGDYHTGLICIGPWSEEYLFHGNIGHEVRHYVDDIQSRIGLENGEATAYLTGYIHLEIYKRVKELK